MRKSRSSEMLKQRKQATNQSRRYQLQPRELRVPNFAKHMIQIYQTNPLSSQLFFLKFYKRQECTV